MHIHTHIIDKSQLWHRAGPGHRAGRPGSEGPGNYPPGIEPRQMQVLDLETSLKSDESL